MSSIKRVKKIDHPEFARRMTQACDGNPDVPPPNYGRLGWFVTQFETRFKQEVTQETVRKWFAGESRPRHKMISYLAQVLKVDEAWLSIGRTPELSEKEQKTRNAVADGAVNVLAGFVQMCGGHPAFPVETDTKAVDKKIDLYAIIRGAQYAFHVVTGQRDEDGWRVAIPVDADECIIIAVLPVTDLHCEFVEMDWDDVEDDGVRKGGTIEVFVPFEENTKKWRRIETFSERL
jgi:transcriptional regulator with XRE-family HTH domain